MDVIFSILVHEKIDVVLNQIENFTKFNPNSGIILHISKKFRKELNTKIDVLINKKNIFINPISIDTGLNDNSQFYAHQVNIEYIIFNELKFEYISFHASNDMFVRVGLIDYLRNFDAGSDIKAHEFNSNWRQAKHAYRDPLLKNLLRNKQNLNNIIFGSQVEGTFMSKEVCIKLLHDIKFYNLGLKKNVVNIILQKFIQNKYFHKIFDIFSPGSYYAKEEIYFSTLIMSYAKVIGLPYVYINWNNGLKIDFEEVHAIINKDYDILKKKSLRDYSINVHDFYAVKRVDRDMNDQLRKLITFLN